ncbi:MAG: phage holin family protein [Lacrimispora sphenoides]
MEVDKIMELLALAWGSPIIKLVVWGVVMDTCFGCIRSIKEHKFNSCFGIDGAIRKISMLASIAFLLVLDQIMHFNLIGFIPEAVRGYLPVSSIGAAEFFGLLYIAYEMVSILKNMTLCGLPVKRLWEVIKKFLSQYTDELPDNT